MVRAEPNIRATGAERPRSQIRPTAHSNRTDRALESDRPRTRIGPIVCPVCHYAGHLRQASIRAVIFETDQALATLLKTRVLGGAPIGVAFDPPSRPWIAALKGPTVNLFMFDLRENPHRRESAYEEIRDENGRVIGRRAPMQRWDLHYTVSVFAPQVLVEHKVLAAVLRYFAGIDVLPEDVLPPALAEPGYPILVSTGSGPKRGMFLNYAGDIKASFEMAITVPIPPLPPPPPAPPAAAAADRRQPGAGRTADNRGGLHRDRAGRPAHAGRIAAAAATGTATGTAPAPAPAQPAT